MIYENIVKGKFISRPNRFIARVLVDGNEEIVHVKNTGRCKELLTGGALVYLQKSDKLERKTKYDLITVLKNGTNLVNMDSQVPNDVVEEFLKKGILFPKHAKIKREMRHGDSRFDFFIECEGKISYMEVKGVTLEENGVASFPDAPTERGVKHLLHLCELAKGGIDAYIFFVIQMKGCYKLIPNRKTHKEFADALIKCRECGVKILCYDCIITENSIEIDKSVPVDLSDIGD
ncbi:MAG: DNA/RNA nuclease SfsA [Clostridia bacterium]|nr:DNA/RNA nuclease SfsA [Clostridia bacterium]